MSSSGDILEGFPHLTITPVIGIPTYESIAEINLKLNANAASHPMSCSTRCHWDQPCCPTQLHPQLSEPPLPPSAGSNGSKIARRQRFTHHENQSLDWTHLSYLLHSFTDWSPPHWSCPPYDHLPPLFQCRRLNPILYSYERYISYCRFTFSSSPC
jgi:hypothetical protein